MPNVYVGGCRIYFWSNENNEPIHVHITEGEVVKDSVKVWINSDNSITIEKGNYVIKKSALDNGVDFIRANIQLIKQKWSDHFHIRLSDIKYKR